MAGLLAEAFDGVTVIDLCDRQGDFGAFSFTEKDVCLVAVPSYGGRVPDAAAQRLGRMNGGGARAVLVAVYGNRAIDDTLLELKDILTAQGFRPVAAVAAVAEHSTMHQFGAWPAGSTGPAATGGLCGADSPDACLRRRAGGFGCAGKPALPGIQTQPHEAECDRPLHPVRQLCPRLPGGCHPATGSVGDGQVAVHLLYAVRVSLPAGRTAAG